MIILFGGKHEYSTPRGYTMSYMMQIRKLVPHEVRWYSAPRGTTTIRLSTRRVFSLAPPVCYCQPDNTIEALLDGSHHALGHNNHDIMAPL